MVATVLRDASTSGPREEQPLLRTCLPKSTTCPSVLRLQPVLISCCLLRESLLSYPESAAVLGRCRFQRKQERSGSQHCLSIHKSFSPRSAQDTRLPTTGRTSKCSRKAIRPTASILYSTARSSSQACPQRAKKWLSPCSGPTTSLARAASRASRGIWLLPRPWRIAGSCDWRKLRRFKCSTTNRLFPHCSSPIC